MTTNESFIGNNLVDDVQQKVKSLMSLLSEIKQPGQNYEIDQSLCNDIYSYINAVQTDCQKVLNDDKYRLFSKTENTIQNVFDGMNTLKSVQIINSNELYYEEFKKFEDEIDFQVDEVIKSLKMSADLLNVYQKENLLLEKQTNDVCQKLNSQKDILNDNIEKFNKTDVKLKNEFNKWKERLKQQSEINVSLVKESHRLILEYQQKMLLVKNNIINFIETLLKSLSLRAECLRLEIRIIWEGDTILKTYKNIIKLIEVNGQKLEYYNELQSQMGCINEEVNRYLDHIACTSSEMKNSIFDQIQRHDDIAKIVEEKCRHLYILNNKIPDAEELLLNSEQYLMDVERQIKENKKEIDIKHKQIEDENIKIKDLTDSLEEKKKLILKTQHIVEEKKSQLQDVELKYERETNELENKKIQLQKKQNNLEIMKYIMNYHKKETQEKLQFYQNNIIQPLELKLEKSIAMVEYEKMRNNELKTNTTLELSPELKETIDNVKSQIVELDKTLNEQYETMKKLKDDFKSVQLEVLHQLNASATKSEKYINLFQNIIDYKTKMANNIEIKQNNTILECELFQKRYALTKKQEKLEKEEKLLMTQINDLKQKIREQSVYNKKLTKKYIQLNKQK